MAAAASSYYDLPSRIGRHKNELDDGWPEGAEEPVTLGLLKTCKKYIKDML